MIPGGQVSVIEQRLLFLVLVVVSTPFRDLSAHTYNDDDDGVVMMMVMMMMKLLTVLMTMILMILLLLIMMMMMTVPIEGPKP